MAIGLGSLGLFFSLVDENGWPGRSDLEVYWWPGLSLGVAGLGLVLLRRVHRGHPGRLRAQLRFSMGDLLFLPVVIGPLVWVLPHTGLEPVAVSMAPGPAIVLLAWGITRANARGLSGTLRRSLLIGAALPLGLGILVIGGILFAIPVIVTLGGAELGDVGYVLTRGLNDDWLFGSLLRLGVMALPIGLVMRWIALLDVLWSR